MTTLEERFARQDDRTAGILLRHLDERTRVLAQIADGRAEPRPGARSRLRRRDMRRMAREVLDAGEPT